MASPGGHGHALSVERGPTHKLTRERSTSRNSSRTSLRTHSPSFSLDDPVAVRTQMSTLKHNIRQKQAQLNTLETVIRSGPRPYPELNLDDDSILTSNGMSPNGHSTSPSVPPPSAFSPTTAAIKMKRRSSYDVLHNLAGPDSNLPLPLPRRDGLGSDENGIREGVPLTFSVRSASPSSYKRVSSPTRTLSRIPVASVGNARALADEGHTPTQRPTGLSSSSKLSPNDPDASLPSPTGTLHSPTSVNRRISLTPGGTTKVLADLQTGVVNARNALENTKAQLRLSQRSVAQLTRQTEDLKEGRERLRLENEGLNNVVARKERLLQEVLERARKAEAEASSLKAQLKTETGTSKKALREMETTLSESTALSQKSEREYLTLRDSIKGLVEGWKHDTERLREEMRAREEKWRAEAEAVGGKYRTLVNELKSAEGGRLEVKMMREEDEKRQSELEAAWREEITTMKSEVENSSKDSEDAAKTASRLAEELARLRRLMQNAGPRAPIVLDPNALIPESVDNDAPP